MIEASRKYYSPAIIDALGVGATNVAAITTITSGGVYKYIYDNTSQTNLVLFYFTSTDYEGKILKFDAFKIKEYLQNTYNEDTSFSRTFIETFELKLQHEQGNACGDAYGDEIYNDLFCDPNDPPCVTDTIDESVTTYAYELEPDEWYSMKDGIIQVDSLTGEWFTTMTLLDTNWNETSDNKEVIIGEDSRIINVCRSAYSDDDPTNPPCNTWHAQDALFYYKEDIVSEYSEATFFVFPIKHDFDFVENSAYQDVLLNEFGLGNGALKESLEDEKIKEALLAYSVNSSYSPFLPYFKEIYGTTVSGFNTVQLNTKYYNIVYYGAYDPLSSYANFQVSINNCKFDVGNKNLMMVPVDIFKEFTMPEMYTFIRDMVNIWGNMEETVKLKWYQTGWFKALTFLMVAGFALFTGNYWAIGLMVGLQIGFKILSEVLPPELMAAIALAVVIFTGDMSSATSSFSTIANISNTISQVYFMQEKEKILKQIDSGNKQAKEEAETLKEMQKDPIYISSLDTYNSYYNLASGEVLYNAYNSMYDSMYDFDNKLNPNGGVKI